MIEIKGLSKTFSAHDGTVEALRDIDLTIGDGEIYGIIGMSGAGKSTLVRCINMLERPTEGQVIIDGVDIGALSPKELREKRREITMIFQSFNLLMQRTCLDNICFPLELVGTPKAQAQERARELLEIVGLPDKANAYPAQLSGGQMQRIAIARALATNPKVLLCDEATSALDPNTTNAILSLIKEINERLGITVIIITHQMSVVEQICTRVAILDNGCVAEEGEVEKIFSAPKSSAARRLVYPEGYDEDMLVSNGDERKIRLVFNGASVAGTPIIAKMAMEKSIAANILYASTRTMSKKVYGSMLLGIPGGDDTLSDVLSYLKDVDGVTVEEVKLDAE